MQADARYRQAKLQFVDTSNNVKTVLQRTVQPALRMLQGERFSLDSQLGSP